MKPHPHAEVLRAIADGVPLSEFEASPTNGWGDASDLYHRIGDMVRFPEKWQIRRKPQYIMVNGFKVPKPLDVMPKRDDDYYGPCFDNREFYESYSWASDSVDDRLFARKVIHATKEAAIAHAKAMLGIDPEYFK
jgi:hypothetical protein